MNSQPWIFVAAFSIGFGGSAATAAPSIEVLTLENSVLPGAGSIPGFLASDVVRNNGQRRASVNAYGDFVAPVHTNLSGSIFYLYGDIDGAGPTALRREAMLSGVTQNTFVTNVGVGRDGVITYSAPLTGAGSPGSLWQDDTLIYKLDDEIPSGPLAGKFFGDVVGNVFTAPSGEVSWSMNYADAAGADEVGVALMRGVNSFDTLLKSGDAIGSLGKVAQSGSFVFTNPEFSKSGTNYLAGVDLNTGDEVLVLSGHPAQFTSGGPLLEGALIPEADGGLTEEGQPIETLILGSNLAVNEAGDFAISASTEFTTDPDSNSDVDVLIYNGSILHREGEMLDGVLLDGLVEALAINDRGDMAFIWSDTLFINGEAVITTSTPLELPDGGGTTTLDRMAVGTFSIANQLAAGGDGLPVVYFAGSVASGDRSVLVRLSPQEQLDGDFNQDGVVDAADYTVWRDTLGSTTDLRADVDRSGEVDQGDYDAWRANYGATAPSVASSSAAPEPIAAWLVACVAIAARHGRR